MTVMCTSLCFTTELKELPACSVHHSLDLSFMEYLIHEMLKLYAVTLLFPNHHTYLPQSNGGLVRHITSHIGIYWADNRLQFIWVCAACLLLKLHHSISVNHTPGSFGNFRIFIPTGCCLFQTQLCTARLILVKPHALRCLMTMDHSSCPCHLKNVSQLVQVSPSCYSDAMRAPDNGW